MRTRGWLRRERWRRARFSEDHALALDFVNMDSAMPRRTGRSAGNSWTLRPPQLLRRRELLHRALLR